MANLRQVPAPSERAVRLDPRADDADCPEAFSPEYWLAHCEGFRVDGPEGKVGIVEEVVLDADGRPQALVVLGGTLGQRRWLVSVADVAVVQPRRERVALVDPLPPATPVEPRA